MKTVILTASITQRCVLTRTCFPWALPVMPTAPADGWSITVINIYGLYKASDIRRNVFNASCGFFCFRVGKFDISWFWGDRILRFMWESGNLYYIGVLTGLPLKLK